MQYMFKNCKALTSLDLTSFDTSKVTNMSYMFENCIALTSLDLTSFDTSNVTNMKGMFRNCTALTEIKVTTGKWDTSNAGTTTSTMFSGCGCSNVTYIN